MAPHIVPSSPWSKASLLMEPDLGEFTGGETRGKMRRNQWILLSHRIHGAAIYGNMDPINIPPMLAYIPAPWILWVSNAH